MDKRIIFVLSLLAVPILQAESCKGLAEALEREQAPTFVKSMPDMLYAGAVASSSTMLSAQQQVMLNPIMKREFSNAFDSEGAYADLLANFATRCDQRKLDAYQVLARTPLALSLGRLAMATLRPEFPSELRAFATGLSKDRPSDARLALVQRLDKAQCGTDMAVRVVESAYRAWEGPSAPPVSAEDLEPLRVQIWQQTNLTNVYLYRTVSDEDLSSYVKLMEQPSARWFFQAYSASFHDVLLSRTTLVMQRIGNRFEAVKNAQH